MNKLKIVITVLLSFILFLSGCTNPVYYLESKDSVEKENTEPKKPSLTTRRAIEELKKITELGKAGDYSIRVEVENVDDLNRIKLTIGNLKNNQFVNLDLSDSENLKEIPNGWMSFRDTQSQIDHVKSIVLPSSVKTIGTDAFAYCKNLEQVFIPEGVEKIFRWSFLECTKLKHAKIPASVTFIEDRAFLRCDDLEQIEVSPLNMKYKNMGPDLFTKDGKLLHTFLNGPNRKVYEIPDCVEKIEDGAIVKNRILEKIIIPKSVTYMGQWFAYEDMPALKSVVFEDEESSWNHGGYPYSPKGMTPEQNCSEVKKGYYTWSKI